ncbi:MAG TPA: replicative DNA helicase [Chloroflexi bacterium]|nr:replicative DNA helicase [Chloroflexota bacterium]
MSEFPPDPPQESSPSPQIVPHSREAEEAVLGAVLINPEAYYDVAQFLRADDFYIHRHQWIWEAFTRLQERRAPIDLLTVTEELEQMGYLDEVGGAAYLTALVGNVPTSLHAEAYGRIVEETAIRRRMLEAANQIAKLAYREELGIDAVMNDAEKAIFGVSERRLTSDLEPIKTVLAEYYARIDQLLRRGEDTYGVPTGFVDLDRLLGGLQPSDLLIIAGRPGQGKTGFMLSAAKNAAQLYKKHVAVFSLEMSNEQLVQRLISQETGIDSQRLRMGKLKEEEWPLFNQAIEALSETHIYLDDTPAITPLQLRTKCRRLHMEFGLDLIIVDYLQLMTSGGRSENRVQEVSHISRNLKVLARELNVPVLAAAQLSRAVEQRADKRPVLSDLRESGCLAGNTLITLADTGDRLPIRDLEGKTDFQILALNPHTYRIEPMPVSRAFCTGTKPVFRLTSRLGRSVRATANHKFLTIDGWKRLDALREGEHIAVPRVVKTFQSAQSMSDAELALLGHLIGDGCTLPRHAIQYTTKEHDLAELVCSLAKSIFGEDVAPRIEQERQWYQVYLASTRHHTHGVHNPVSQWMRELGIFGLRSYEKRLPQKVFKQPNEAIALFLRHLWATDGSVQLTKGKKPRPIAYYATSSPQLAEDVQSLLLRLGINAVLNQTPQKGKGRDLFSVRITGKPDLSRFIEHVGAVGRYQQGRLAEIQTYLREHGENTNRDVIPRQVWRKHVVPAMGRIGMSTRQMQAELGTAYAGTGIYKRNLGRKRAKRVATLVHSEELRALAESDVYWDRIVSIEPDGEEPVFDLTVPGHHNFVADNIIVHNSLEQDADVVMFIYRPDYYDKETVKQNVAEIIVAKHRNGPVGSIELIFRSKLAKFENAATREVDLSALT